MRILRTTFLTLLTPSNVVESTSNCLQNLHMRSHLCIMWHRFQLDQTTPMPEFSLRRLAFSSSLLCRLTREGAVGLNASTSQDATQFVASMPSNKLELWFALEADRFQVVARAFRNRNSQAKLEL